MKRILTAACLLVPVLAACAGGTGTTEQSAPAASFAPISTPAQSQGAADTPAPAATPEPADTPNPDDPVTYQPNDVIHVTENDQPWADIVVSKVSQKAKYDGPYNLDDVPKKGHIYIQALVTYTAKTDGVDYNPFDWQVFVNGEAVDNTTYVSNGPDPELDSGTLPKGRKASGWVVYEVPKTGRVLMSYGNTFSNDAPVFEVVIRAK